MLTSIQGQNDTYLMMAVQPTQLQIQYYALDIVNHIHSLCTTNMICVSCCGC